MRSKVEVVGAVLPRPSSELISRFAWYASSLLESGPPLVSVPPRTRKTIDATTTAPDPTRVAMRWRLTKRPQRPNTSVPSRIAGGQRHDGQGVDGLVGVELRVDQRLDDDAQDGRPDDAGDATRRLWVSAALAQHLPRDVLDVQPVAADELANAGTDHGVVEADADELDVERVGAATLAQHVLGLGVFVTLPAEDAERGLQDSSSGVSRPG